MLYLLVLPCFPTGRASLTQRHSNRGNICAGTCELSYGVMLKRWLFWMEAHVIIMFGPHLSIGLFVSSADPVFLGQDLRVLRWNCFRGKWDWYCPSDFQNHMWTIRAEYFNRSKKLYVLAMQWTVELFYEACLLTYKLNNFKLIWHLKLIYFGYLYLFL